MAERMIRTTGVLKGLQIPESRRGQFVVIVGGKIVAGSPDMGEMVSKAIEFKGRALLLDVPKNDHAIAAY